jgi:hypothetical protein
MATSRAGYLGDLCQLVVSKRPRRILDIGVGFGKNGFLCREYSELWGGHHRLPPDEWETTIDGIEAHGEYLHAWQFAIYSTIIIGDALEVLPTLDDYDLIVATDVLEHFNSADAVAMLDLIRDKSRHFLVTTPDRFLAQGAVAGNEYERHRCHLDKRLLRRYGAVTNPRLTFVCQGQGRVR